MGERLRKWNPASEEWPLVLQFGQWRVGVNLPVTVAGFGNADGRVYESVLRRIFRHEVQTDEQLDKVIAACRRHWPELVEDDPDEEE